MEFGLSEALPIYSGGLGNVAGDQLKAASDLGVPVVGVGLLYQQGYFRQAIAADGRAGSALPVQRSRPAAGHAGARARAASGSGFQFELPGCKIWLRAWQVQVGRLRLYLLDSNDPANRPPRAASPASSTAAARSSASAGDRSWASAAGGCCGRFASSPRSAT